MRRRVLRRLIWVYTVCSGLSVPILMVNMVHVFVYHLYILLINTNCFYFDTLCFHNMMIFAVDFFMNIAKHILSAFCIDSVQCKCFSSAHKQ